MSTIYYLLGFALFWAIVAIIGGIAALLFADWIDRTVRAYKRK